MKITLKNMIFYGYHGTHAEERTLGQRFAVDVIVTTDPLLDQHINSLEDTVDYTKIYSEVKHKVEDYKFQLLEMLCQEIQHTLMKKFPTIQHSTIKIRKVAVPINGNLDFVEVEMDQQRNG